MTEEIKDISKLGSPTPPPPPPNNDNGVFPPPPDDARLAPLSPPPLPPPPPPEEEESCTIQLDEKEKIGKNSNSSSKNGPKPARWGSRDVSAFDILEQVGEGTYGEVFKARCKASMNIVALKKIRMDKESEGFPITAIREIKILKSLSHENIVQLKEIVTSKGDGRSSVYLVFEYLEHDLAGLLATKSVHFGHVRIKCYMKQLLDGVAYMHKQKILHRDLKASNLLLDNQGRLKIADWGLSRPWSEQYSLGYTNNVVSLWYRCPELLLGLKHYDLSVDIWSVGCIMAELLLGRPVLAGESEIEQLTLIFELLGTPTPSSWPGYTSMPKAHTLVNTGEVKGNLKERFKKFPQEALDLVEKLLTLDPSKRLTASEALEHDYFWVDPRPCKPYELPKFSVPSVHEFQAKRMHREKTLERSGHDQRAAKKHKAAPSGSHKSHYYRPYHYRDRNRGNHGEEKHRKRRTYD